jgi:hypothetical protein
MSKFTDYANLASNLAQNAQLSEVEYLLSKQTAHLADAAAKAARETGLRNSLFKIQKIVAETIETQKSNPFLLAWGLLMTKRQAIDVIPICDPSEYTAWEDKERASGLGKLVETTLADCKQKLGDADYQKLLSSFAFEYGDKVSLTEYGEALKSYELSQKQSESESELAERAEENRKAWEAKRGKWSPYRIANVFVVTAQVVALLSFLVMVPSCIYDKSHNESGRIADTNLFFYVSGQAFVYGLVALLVLSVIRAVVSKAGEKAYGPCPPKPEWPTAAARKTPVVAVKKGEDLAKWVKKIYPKYSEWKTSNDELEAKLVSYRAKHGDLSRSDIEARIKAAEEPRNSIAAKYQ